MEPFSFFGCTNTNGTWDGKQTSSTIGGEAEILLQWSTQFIVRDISKSGNDYHVVLQVVGQL